MMSDLYPRIDPKQIVVLAGRQRQENVKDVDDLKQSINAIRLRHPESTGIIQPLIVRPLDDKTILVAGERRLRAALELDLPNVPIRYFSELTHEEAEIVELEENVKRKDLSWRDQVRAVGRIHILYKKQNGNWNIEKSADALGIHQTYLRKILHVFDALDTGRIDRAENIDQAYNTLHRFSERKAESIVGDLIVKGAQLFSTNVNVAATPTINTGAVINNDTIAMTSAIKVEGDVNVVPFPLPATSFVTAIPTVAPSPADPIICSNFVEWIKTYTGPKFSLIHCDFPYGNYRGGDSTSINSMETEEFYDNNEAVYWTLLDALTSGLDRIMSYSAHMIFWFQMGFYTETVAKLRKTGLIVHDHPLVWHKTGGPGGLGVAPGTIATHPRRTYDTALLCVRGNRPLVRGMSNSYAAPTAGNKIHPSQKPEPMLRYFLQMVVDETTTMLDPTCGSGAALRAAEDLRAKLILGLELDSNYASQANTKTLQARILRQMGTMSTKKAEELL